MTITLPGKAATFMASQRDKAEKQRQALGVEARSWYRISNAASQDEAEVMLYDEVGGWFGATADQFIADLRGVTAPNLRVRVNSPGGSVFEGIAIANALRSHPANVTVQVDGIAASIASVIAMAGDRIEMAPNTMLMIHDASGVCLGNAADMEEMAELLDLISDNIADAYAARAGGTRDEWRALMRAETWFLPDAAVEAGLADEATKTPASGTPTEPDEGEPEPDMHRAFDFAAYGYTGPRREEPKADAEPQSEQVTLTFNLGESFGQEFAEILRKTVAQLGEPADGPTTETAPEVVDTASPVHHTATEDRPWDAGPNEKRLPSPMTVKTAKAMYAWYDDTQVADGELPKAACKLPHHEVSADGVPGAANLSGVRNALARLPQSDIPASQHDAVRRHLQAHLDDAKAADNQAEAEPTAAAPEPESPAPDPWAELTAHLTQDEPDAWSVLVSTLTTTASSSAATEA